MKEYVVLEFINNSLVFNFRKLREDEKNKINKNIFYKDTLFYSLNYLKKHIKKITNKYNDYTIEWFIVRRIITFRFAVSIMNELKINNLRLLFESSLSLDDYNLILTIKSLKKVDCYYMPSFMIEKYNKEGVEVKLNNYKKISDKFMLSQDAFDNDVLYYKKKLELKEEYDGLLDDVKEFLKLNYNLKSIDIYIYSKELIEQIIGFVRKDESKNIVVLLHQTYDKGNFIIHNFKWLKELNYSCKKDSTCEFRILYSNNYVRNNLFKQLTFNNLKLMFILMIYVSVSALVIYKSYEYVDKLNSDKLKIDLMNSLANKDITIEEELNDIDISLTDSEEKELEKTKSKYELDNIMSSLSDTNNETVSYLAVNNTSISYPVVQHSDNYYYLKHDFFKKSNNMGWIFMDYRNSNDKLDQNIIIYGHSMKNGTMFGSLKKVLSSTWRKNNENMIISYDTKYGSYKFKVFSIYKVDYTTDYLKINFDGEIDFNNFVNMIKKRSVFKSDEIIEYGNPILTLSTCTGSSNQRLVVHAIMMEV